MPSNATGSRGTVWGTGGGGGRGGGGGGGWVGRGFVLPLGAMRMIAFAGVAASLPIVLFCEKVS